MVEVIAGSALALVLGLASLIDARSMILPDWLTLPLIPAGWALASLGWPPPMSDRILGTIVGFLSFAIISRIYRCARARDGLGLGDAKLLAAAGGWCGWESLPLVVLIASCAAIIWVVITRLDLRRPLPFGPFLALGFWISWWLDTVN